MGAEAERLASEWMVTEAGHVQKKVDDGRNLCAMCLAARAWQKFQDWDVAHGRSVSPEAMSGYRHVENLLSNGCPHRIPVKSHVEDYASCGDPSCSECSGLEPGCEKVKKP